MRHPASTEALGFPPPRFWGAEGRRGVAEEAEHGVGWDWGIPVPFARLTLPFSV